MAIHDCSKEGRFGSGVEVLGTVSRVLPVIVE